MAVLIVGVAVLAGLAAGDPSPLWWIPMGILVAGGTLYVSARWPFASLLIMLGSSILLVVVRMVGLRSVNAIDILLPQVLLASLLGRARRESRANIESGTLHERLHFAERRLLRSVVLFYGLAAVSLVQLASLAGVGAALDSALLLVRAAQGLLIYPLCMWWLRNPQRIGRAWDSIVVAGTLLAIVNLIARGAWGTERAGMTFYLNNWDAPLSSPNEAGTATLVVAVVLLIRHSMRPEWRNLALGALMVMTLGLTQSRSGILAWATFALLTLRWVRPARLLTGALGMAAILPLLPQTFWIRMARSLAVERGTNEVNSFFQRVYGWRVAWSVFLDHPWTGVGYLGFRFVSHSYNELRIIFITVENYFYEILVSMGVVGLALLVIVIVRLFQLGREVGRVAPPGTLAFHMARFHSPLLIALLVANMTGDNFMGMVSLAQLALWTAVLVRSGHAAVAEAVRAA
jgi:O-antigen ligase